MKQVQLEPQLLLVAYLTQLINHITRDTVLFLSRDPRVLQCYVNCIAQGPVYLDEAFKEFLGDRR